LGVAGLPAPAGAVRAPRHGEATVWLGQLGSAGQERALAQRMADAVALDYAAVVAEAGAVAGEAEAVRRRTVARLRRELQRIARRDFFPPPERDQARAEIERLAATVAVP